MLIVITLSVVLLSVIMLCAVILCAYLMENNQSINRALDGSTYSSLKLVCSALGKKITVVKEHGSLFLGLVVPSVACIINIL